MKHKEIRDLANRLIVFSYDLEYAEKSEMNDLFVGFEILRKELEEMEI